MPRTIVRVVRLTMLGALAGAFLALGFHAFSPAIVLDMDRDLPPFTSGFHPVERSGEETFAWTSERAVVRLAQLDRRIGWTCSVRVRGARDAGVALPEVTLAIEGSSPVTAPTTNEFREISIAARARPSRSGLTLTIGTIPTFIPGPSDSRVLGAQVDWVRCDPGGGLAILPSRAIVAAATGTGALAGAAALAGMSTPAVLTVMLVVALGLSTLLTSGGGAFGGYPQILGRVATAVAVVSVVIGRAPLLWRRVPLTGAPAIAILAASVILCLKLGALLHPDKTLVDAVFQAHRLDWVLSGRYLFTQPLPSGVEFPYAIGLYVTAMPWAAVVDDHVMLLRIVVLAADAAAGLLLYPVIVRAWGDRLAGVLAVVLFGLVPLPYVVVGNANLTNAFAQSVALMAVALVALRATHPGRVSTIAGLTLLTGLAVLSHVSTMVLLVALLAGMALTFRFFGGGELRRISGAILLSLALASLVATGLYYRHFTDVYREGASRVRAEAPRTDETAGGHVPSGADRLGSPAGAPDILSRQLAWHERLLDAAEGTTRDIGWPLLVLGAIGAWRVRAQGRRDGLTLMLVSWAGVWIGFLVLGTLTRVDTQYQRYAAEFIGRVNLAMFPAAVLLAGFGASWAWRGSRSFVWRAAAVVLISAALITGVRAWIAWVQ